HTLVFRTTPCPPSLPTLSLHDALPIFVVARRAVQRHLRSLPHDLIDARIGDRRMVDVLDVDIHHVRRAVGQSVVHDDLADSAPEDRKSTRLNSSHDQISYAVFGLKKKK